MRKAGQEGPLAVYSLQPLSAAILPENWFVFADGRSSSLIVLRRFLLVYAVSEE